MAAAYAGRKLKMPVTVVVPETTPEFTINKIKEEGASVIVKGKVKILRQDFWIMLTWLAGVSKYVPMSGCSSPPLGNPPPLGNTTA